MKHILITLVLFWSINLIAQEPKLKDTKGNIYDNDPAPDDEHEALQDAYAWGIKHIVCNLSPLGNKPFALRQGYYFSEKPRKVIVYDSATIKTLSEPIAPIEIFVGTLSQQSATPVIRVQSSSDMQLLIIVGTLPDSYQLGLTWTNYLAVDLYDCNTIGSYRLVSINNSLDTRVMVGSLVGQWGTAKGKPFHNIFGAMNPSYNTAMRFVGTFEPVNYDN